MIGAYVALLGGVDILIFTGGIGIGSERVRKAVLYRLQWLVLREMDQNADPLVQAAVVMETDESRQMFNIYLQHWQN